MIDIRHGDCLEVLRAMPDGSVDAVVTDPPYGLSFMGKKWDYDVPSVKIWQECLRVLKPGGHLLAFAGTRTQHRIAVRIEDAGFEIRDMIAWVYGSGFPKSHDVSKAIDKAAGAEREVVGKYRSPEDTSGGKGRKFCHGGQPLDGLPDITAPATPEAQQWAGWGTALKPALEPITVARKPLAGTVAENVLAHGTGAVNVEGCRVGTEEVTINTWNDGAKPFGGGAGHEYTGRTVQGRWPANLIHDGSDEVVGLFPESGNGSRKPTIATRQRNKGWCNSSPGQGVAAIDNYGDSGSAARFFYCAKASKRDRDEGLEGFEAKNNMRVNGPRENEDAKHATKRANHHPTVKPTDLMRYLCRLVTPPGGVVLDPFCGSGSTGKAAVLEGFRFIGIERDPQYLEIARARVAASRREPEQVALI